MRPEPSEWPPWNCCLLITSAETSTGADKWRRRRGLTLTEALGGAAAASEGVSTANFGSADHNGGAQTTVNQQSSKPSERLLHSNTCLNSQHRDATPSPQETHNRGPKLAGAPWQQVPPGGARLADHRDQDWTRTRIGTPSTPHLIATKLQMRFKWEKREHSGPQRGNSGPAASPLVLI